jgi:hypothetical protein
MQSTSDTRYPKRGFGVARCSPDHHDSDGAIVLRPNGFSQPDYSVIDKDPDGQELAVGRIFRNHGLVGGGQPRFWGVEFFQRAGRAEPHQGQVDTLDEAKAAWRQCRDSADVPIHWPLTMRRESSNG